MNPRDLAGERKKKTKNNNNNNNNNKQTNKQNKTKKKKKKKKPNVVRTLVKCLLMYSKIEITTLSLLPRTQAAILIQIDQYFL